MYSVCGLLPSQAFYLMQDTEVKVPAGIRAGRDSFPFGDLRQSTASSSLWYKTRIYVCPSMSLRKCVLANMPCTRQHPHTASSRTSRVGKLGITGIRKSTKYIHLFIPSMISSSHASLHVLAVSIVYRHFSALLRDSLDVVSQTTRVSGTKNRYAVAPLATIVHDGIWMSWCVEDYYGDSKDTVIVDATTASNGVMASRVCDSFLFSFSPTIPIASRFCTSRPSVPVFLDESSMDIEVLFGLQDDNPALPAYVDVQSARLVNWATCGQPNVPHCVGFRFPSLWNVRSPPSSLKSIPVGH
jgi:hypothetical protein